MFQQPKIVTTLQGYDGLQLRADILAGITVAMLAIPLSLAIAIASGVPPGSSLVTAVVAGILISALGGSRVQIGGPTGAFIVVVAGVVATKGIDGLVAATFLAGLLLVLAGVLRAGRLMELVPEAVINGFTIGIAAIIATSQLKDLLGLHPAHDPADLLEKVPALWAARGTLSPSALFVGATTAALIVGLRRIAPRWPGLIVAMALGSALAAVVPGVETLGDRFGALPSGLPVPRLPDLSAGRVWDLLPSALVIAFLAGIESLLSATVADRLIRGKHRPDAELVAQGVANLGSALFGGLPATGAIARTATNVRAGGRTPVAGIVHAIVVLVVMMLAAPLAGHLAMPALAALLIVTAWNMSEPHKWRGYAKEGWAALLLLVTTLVLTVAVDLTVAIGTGIVLGLALRRLGPGSGAASGDQPASR
ncbi:SulP family inorganic anion transporter [Rubellimicrobium arenae]|uniref:SulP family inorganic anion transporter n=1 Tax=Rubellimicrobium arenae TaxID=2817372 RepID=UPI001B3068B1|nr:SulP family inorganic anion transporter [Rubellimicrobium arenae]